MQHHGYTRKALAAALTLTPVGSLTACGGGGGNGSVAPTPPPDPAHGSTPTPPPPPPPAPEPAAYTLLNNQLVPTGATTAWQAGINGQGVKLADVDGGIVPTNPTLDGSLSDGRNKVAWFHNYAPDATDPAQVTEVDNWGHGNAMAMLMAGDPDHANASDPFSGKAFNGGVAPGASLYVAGICYGSDGPSDPSDPSGAKGGPLCHPGTQVFQDLVAQGVQIANLEFDAGDITTATPASALGMANVLMTLINANVLAVVPTGDEYGTSKNAGVYAGLPYLYPNLQPDMLAVTGANVDADGKPTAAPTVTYDVAGFTPYSVTTNATPCGVAAQWCLAAPVFTQAIASLPHFPTGGGVGTSDASAIVAGVAALVQQAYPWMQGPQLATTLLTTATPLDDGSGQRVNPTFGWGFVNVAAAIHGPAEFAFPQFGPFLAPVPAGMTSTFSNDISGAGGLQVNGAGTLVLTGTNTYQGGTEIASGTLQLNGSVASDVTVDGGTLAGEGTVNANVGNTAGTVASTAGTAGKSLTITGTYTAGAGAFTNVALGHPLQVGGTAALDGTMQVFGGDAGYVVKSTEDLLDAGSVGGTFANLVFASGVFYTGTLNYSPTQVSVALVQNDVSQAAAAMPRATPQAVAAATHVQSALDVSNGWVTQGSTAGHGTWLQDAGQFLAAPTAANAVASLNSLSGEIYATSRAVEAEQTLATDDALANRQHDLLHGEQAGVWVQAMGANGGLSRNGYDAASYLASGTLVGVDGSFGHGFSGGLAAGRVRANSDMAGLGGNLDGREDVVAAYGNLAFTNGWYVSGRVSQARVRNDVSRDLLLNQTLYSLHGARHDDVTGLTLESSKRMTLSNGTSLTPYAAITDLRFKSDGFAEQGSTMGLAAADQTHNAVLGSLGVRYGQQFQWALGNSYLSAYAAYRRVLSGNDLGLTMTFNGVNEVSFRAQGQNLSQSTGMFGASLNTRINALWSWFIDADYTAGSHVHQVQADLGMRLGF